MGLSRFAYNADMTRKRGAAPAPKPETAPKPPKTPKLRGRPPGEARTALARWIRAEGMTVIGFAATLHSAAAEIGLPDSAVPATKTLRDIVNRRHRPSLETVRLVSHATRGEVYLDQWLDDLGAR